MAQTYDANKAAEILLAKGVSNYVCPICGGRGFSIHENAGALLVTSELGQIDLTHIPTSIIICSSCGHIELFAMSRLGLIKE